MMKYFFLYFLSIFIFPFACFANLNEVEKSSPPIEVSCTVEHVYLRDNLRLNDGFDFNSELFLNVVFNSNGQTIDNVPHSRIERTFKEMDFNYVDSTYNYWQINSLVDDYVECWPRTEASMFFSIVEMDTNGTLSTINSLASTIVGAYVGYKISKVHPILGTCIGGAVGFISSLPFSLNGNDLLGQATGILPASGSCDVDLVTGTKHSASVKVVGKTEIIPGDDRCCKCVDLPPEKITETKHDIEKSLLEAFQYASKIEPESGNPSFLEESHIQGIQKTLERSAVGLSKALAGAAIDSSLDRVGVEKAIEYFNEGNTIIDNEVDGVKAIQTFCNAYNTALMTEKSKSGKKIKFPFDLHVVPDYFSTESCKSPEILAIIFGSGNNIEIRIENLPDGITYEINKVDPDDPVFLIKLKISQIDPGDYKIKIISNDSKSLRSEKELVLSITSPRLLSDQCLYEETPLRVRLTEEIKKYADLYVKYQFYLKEYDKYDQTDNKKAVSIKKNMNVIRSQMESIRDSIISNEQILSNIENRPVRDMIPLLKILPPVIELKGIEIGHDDTIVEGDPIKNSVTVDGENVSGVSPILNAVILK